MPKSSNTRELYFAYGSNMSPARLRFRLSGARILSPARLPGHRLAFHKTGSDGSAKCDIPECSGRRVLGMVYEITREELGVLDRIEGVGAGYRRERLDVHIGDEVLAVHAYIATWIDPALRPFSWYRHHVYTGARSIGLPESYVSRIRKVDAVRDPDAEREQRELAIYNVAEGRAD